LPAHAVALGKGEVYQFDKCPALPQLRLLALFTVSLFSS